MDWKKRLSIPALVSLAYLVASFFVKIVPCQISARVPNPTLTWSLCTINPDKNLLFGLNEVYWGITSNLSQTYLITIGLVFVCVFIFLHPFRKVSFNKSQKKQQSERGFETF